MKTELIQILNSVKNGGISVEEAALKLKMTPFEDIGYAKIDMHRKIRQGAAEVIYGAGKTAEQIAGIINTMLANGQKNILITRLDRKAAEFINKSLNVDYHEDAKIGITIIFYLQNVPQYLKEKQLSGNKMNYTSVTLAGLCESGTILLPVKKNHSQKERQREEVYNRMQLLSAAKSGDPNAIETLTLEDIDTYSKVSRRLVTEDVFSIVDTYIMPYSVECDRYSILGEIQELHEIVNEYTGENVYVMKLDVNGLVFDVCVPRQGLLGEPAVGRRFKANMWLQGYINY